MAVLREIVDDTKAPPAARATAAQALLDRGWGKAPIQIDLNVRQKFDDFLREVALSARADRELIDAEAVDSGE
jgi:phytoene/squalene synthetase